MNNKKKIYIAILLSIITIILETLPWGAILIFKRPTSTGSVATLRETYSYFSLEPMGWFNWGPFVTAILTCVLLALLLIYCFTRKMILFKLSQIICIVALFFSLLPLLFFGIGHISIIGVLISVVLLTQYIILIRN